MHQVSGISVLFKQSIVDESIGFSCISSQFAYLVGNDPKWRFRNILYTIRDWENPRTLVQTQAGMYTSIFVFGYPVTKTTYSGYILNDNGEYSIYKPRQWNHMCFAWSSGGESKVVLVTSKILFYS